MITSFRSQSRSAIRLSRTTCAIVYLGRVPSASICASQWTQVSRGPHGLPIFSFIWNRHKRNGCLELIGLWSTSLHPFAPPSASPSQTLFPFVHDGPAPVDKYRTQYVFPYPGRSANIRMPSWHVPTGVHHTLTRRTWVHYTLSTLIDGLMKGAAFFCSVVEPPGACWPPSCASRHSYQASLDFPKVSFVRCAIDIARFGGSFLKGE
jgi:hypothetical protein